MEDLFLTPEYLDKELCKVLAIRYGYADGETMDWIQKNLFQPLLAKALKHRTRAEIETEMAGIVAKYHGESTPCRVCKSIAQEAIALMPDEEEIRRDERKRVTGILEDALEQDFVMAIADPEGETMDSTIDPITIREIIQALKGE